MAVYRTRASTIRELREELEMYLSMYNESLDQRTAGEARIRELEEMLDKKANQYIKLWRELTGMREEMATLKHYRTSNESLAETVRWLMEEKRELEKLVLKQEEEVAALKAQLAATPVIFEQDELDSSTDTLVIDDPNEEREESLQTEAPRLTSIVEREEGEGEARTKATVTRSLAAFFGVGGD